jgi:hypothetical protein
LQEKMGLVECSGADEVCSSSTSFYAAASHNLNKSKVMLAAVILFFVTLSRADWIERLKAPSVIKNEGLIEVSGFCDPQVRSEFQLPVAANASRICDELCDELKIKPVKYKKSRIFIVLGDNLTTNNEVSVSYSKLDSGEIYAKIRLPSPGYADIEKFSREVSRAFFTAINNRTISDSELEVLLRNANPALRLDDDYKALDDWSKKGIYRKGWTDEDYLKLLRKVKKPGSYRKEDVLVFSSRLYLYPEHFAEPFCGTYFLCTFKDAIKYAKIDINVRKAALAKSSELLVFGSGRGDKFAKMAKSYSNFLLALASGKASESVLEEILKIADRQLNEVME